MNFKFKITTFFVLAVTLVLVSCISYVKANSSDAIAVRVIPNPNHYSIQTWYEKQGFQGSPQSLVVDGYNAIRDGRTVYVNAANVDTVNQKFYTNIYLISYNQQSQQETTDVLGQIISHWKFNINVDSRGKCALSSMTCREDDDCPQGYVCGNEVYAFQDNKCVIEDNSTSLQETPGCLIDNDCPAGLYCNSLKSRVIRDVKRLGKISDLNAKLEDYKNQNKNFPILASGTYLPHMTLSVWPSWYSVFASKVGFGLEMIDPINTIGACPGYNLKTCWDEASKSFYDNDPYSSLDLPTNSNIISYVGTPQGDTYNMCATMESGYSTGDGVVENNDCGTSVGYSSEAENNPPEIVEYNLSGKTGETFSGYIKVRDPEADPINWNLENGEIQIEEQVEFSSEKTFVEPRVLNGRDGVLKLQEKYDSNYATGFCQIVAGCDDYVDAKIVADGFYSCRCGDWWGCDGSSCTYPNGWWKRYSEITCIGCEIEEKASQTVQVPPEWESWSGSPKLQDTGTPNQKRVYAYKAGNPGIYPLELTLSDNKGASITETLEIKIQDSIPEIEAGDGRYIMSSGQEFNYTLYFEDNSLDTPPNTTLTIDYNLPNTAPSPSQIEANTENTDLGHGLSKNITKVGENRYKLEITGVLGDSDGDGQVDEDLGITETTFNTSFEVTDSEGNTIVQDFDIDVMKSAPMFEINCSENTQLKEEYYCQLDLSSADKDLTFSYSGLPNGLTGNNQGVISGASTEKGDYFVSITATDAYNNQETRNFNLSVVTHCGDGIKQEPNDERIGGLDNTGYEQCDEEDGTASNAYESSKDFRYGCNINCIYTGGWCGDEKLQEDYEDCEGELGIAQSPEDSSADKQYACNQYCGYTGGYCGDDILHDDDGENCDTNQNIATTASDSSLDKQYSCDSNCEHTGGYCGDGQVQTTHEECDFSPTKNCCSFSSCTWKTDNFEQVRTYFKDDGYEYTMISSNETTAIRIPDARGIDKDSGLVDVELSPDIDEVTDIVYITDVSGSMGTDGVENVKEALIGPELDGEGGALKDLYNFSKNEGAPVKVGLVEFGTDVESYSPLGNITSDIHFDDLLEQVQEYTVGGSTHTKTAVEKGEELLDARSDFDNKIIVLLTDGKPSNDEDPDTTCTNLKQTGVEIYTIAYSNATDDTDLQADMCDWSSDNGSNCYTENYSYLGEDASTVFNKITDAIIDRPEDLTLKFSNSVSTTIPISGDTNELPDRSFSFPGDVCGNVGGTDSCNNWEEVELSAEGDTYNIKLSNVRLNILELCE